MMPEPLVSVDEVTMSVQDGIEHVLQFSGTHESYSEGERRWRICVEDSAAVKTVGDPYSSSGVQVSLLSRIQKGE